MQSRAWAGTIAAMLVAAAGAATGADRPLPLKAAPAVSAFDWSGFYAGGDVGYWSGHDSSVLSDANPAAARQWFGTAFGGLHFGYNYVLASRVLLGWEADIGFANHLNSNSILARRNGPGNFNSEAVDYVGTLRARVGTTFDRWLVYATGGFAYSQERLLESSGLGDDKLLRLRPGWVAGAGIEFALARYWSARIEYLYYSLGSVEGTFATGDTYRSTFDMQTLRIGLSRQLRDPEFVGPKSSDAAGSPDWPRVADWNVHGQFTFIGQGYPSFRSPYEGTNSLQGSRQAKNTTSATAFIGIRPWEGGELYLNPELMQGFGLSGVHGVAAFPNGEAQKSNYPFPRFNMPRMFLRQTWGFGGEQETIPDGPNQLAGKQDISRLTVTVGKFSVIDFFDANTYAGEPRTGFMNWNMYGGGSYDLTMDRLAWTWGAMAELNQKAWAFRAGYFLLPAVSNVDNFDMHIPDRGEYIAEWEYRYTLLAQPGRFRLMGWINHGTMGGFADALALPLSSANYPDITLTRRVRTNYGFVANIEQAINEDFGVFSRVSWSPGEVELLGWTDADATASFGGLLKGTSWGRPNDKVGVGGVVEALSGIARRYFEAGGLGILIGDGQLNYHYEKALEAYYGYALNGWSTFTVDYQFIVDPGYNADRGPVSVFSLRYHAEW